MRPIVLSAMTATCVALQLLPAPAGAAKPAQKTAVAAPAGFRANRDAMEGITWYEPASAPKYVNSSAFYLYFGKNDAGAVLPLRLKITYFGDDWLFVTKAWAKADGVTVNVPSESNMFGWQRDNAGGKVWEYSDTPLVSAEDRAAVRRIAEAKTVTVRFEGKQYRKDRTLNPAQLKSMRDTIALYEKESGKSWR